VFHTRWGFDRCTYGQVIATDPAKKELGKPLTLTLTLTLALALALALALTLTLTLTPK
jgi:hypothetical protein